MYTWEIAVYRKNILYAKNKPTGTGTENSGSFFSREKKDRSP